MKSPIALLALTVTLGLASTAHAGQILQPVSASTNMGTFLGSPNNVRNQSGLSVGYTSLVTDFDTYIASNPTHVSNDNANRWISGIGSSTGNFDFNLGGEFTIESFALWNLGGNLGGNVRGFELLASADSTFSSTTNLGSFVASANTGPSSAVLPEVFTFTPTTAAFVRMVITSNFTNSTTGFGEAAFEGTPAVVVPEPSTVVLLGIGAAVLLAAGRRRLRRRD